MQLLSNAFIVFLNRPEKFHHQIIEIKIKNHDLWDNSRNVLKGEK